MSDNEFVRHIPCPQCGSSDANSLYSDGHTFCFRCYTHSHGDSPEVNHTHSVHNVRLQGSAGRLQSRGISEKTAEFYKTYKDGDVLRHYYFDSSGKVVGAKVRTPDKQFRVEGKVKTLFGMNKFPKTTKINQEPTRTANTSEQKRRDAPTQTLTTAPAQAHRRTHTKTDTHSRTGPPAHIPGIYANSAEQQQRTPWSPIKLVHT